MKKFLFNVVIFLVIILTGCQGNSIIDPIEEPRTQKSDDPAVNTGIIVLERMLQDPHPIMNSYYIVNGQIQYQHTLNFIHPIPLKPQYLITLNLSVCANFTYLCTVCSPDSNDISVGRISMETNDKIDVPEKGDYMLVKTFEVIGRDDGMVLKCSFLVTTIGVKLNSMQLAIQDSYSARETIL